MTTRGILKRDEVINQIIKDPQYMVICQNIAEKTSMAKDLYQEVMLVLLQYNAYKLWRMYSKKRRAQFRFIYARIAVNVYNQKYYREYKRLVKTDKIWLLMENLPAHEDGTEDRGLWVDRVHASVQAEIKRIEKEHNGAFPFDVKLFETYLQMGNLRGLEKATGINYYDCYHTINKMKNRIKKNVSLETHHANN